MELLLILSFAIIGYALYRLRNVENAIRTIAPGVLPVKGKK